MKAIITAVLMMLVVGFVVQQASASGIISFGQGSFAGMDMNRMETKMAEALKSLGAKPQVRAAVETDSRQDNSMISPIDNSSSLSATSINSTTNSTELDLGIDDELSSLKSSAALIAEELESIESETSSLGSSADAIRGSPEPYLAANNLSTFDASLLNSTINSTGRNMTSISSSLLNNSALNANINLTEVNLTEDNLSASYPAAMNLAPNSTELNRTSINSSLLNNSALNANINSTEVNLTDNLSALYPAAMDLALNSTALNLSANNSSGSKKVDSTQSGQNIATQQIGDCVSGAVNGFWGIQSSQHQMGRNDINSKTFLSGGFEVDKSVKFSDRGV